MEWSGLKCGVGRRHRDVRCTRNTLTEFRNKQICTKYLLGVLPSHSISWSEFIFSAFLTFARVSPLIEITSLYQSGVEEIGRVACEGDTALSRGKYRSEAGALSIVVDNSGTSPERVSDTVPYSSTLCTNSGPIPEALVSNVRG